tara:strand:+ start:344 stop:2524 length:2181 start_codon:yes stop_codon:yes gene_type:complete
MRLNAINPKDNPLDEVLYCFGSAGDFDDSVGQSVGGGRDDSDDDDDERDRVAKRAGVSKDTIVGSGPGGGNVVRSRDGTPVKAGRSVEREAEREGVSVEEINQRINDAYSFETLGFDEEDLADSSVLDEIAFEFDNIDVESATDAEFYEDEILRGLRREGDYSGVFDLVPQEPDFAPEVTSDFVPDEVTEGLDAVVAETERGRAIDELIVAFQNSIFADQLPSSGDPQQQVEDLLTSIGERATAEKNLEPFSIERIQNITEDLLKNPANRETIQTSVGEIPVSDLVASTQAERAAAADAAARAGLDASTETTTQTVGDMTITEGPDGKTITRGNMSNEEREKIFQEGEAKEGLTQSERMDQAFEDPEKEITADAPDLSPDPFDDLDPRLFDEDEQADLTDRDAERSESEGSVLEITYPDPDLFDLDDQADFRDRRAARTVDEDTGLPVSARQAESPTFSDPDVPLYGDEDYLDLYGAEPGVSLVDARLKAVEDIEESAEEQGDLLDIPFTFVDDVLNQLLKADALTKERLEGGDFAIYSTGPTQEIIGSVDKDTGAITPSSDNFFNTELNPYYEEYERQQELARPSPSENEDIPAEPVEIAPEVITPYDFDSIIRSIVDGTETETGTDAAEGTESLPAVGQPAFDFMRDFGAFSLSPQPDDAPERIYSPTYLAPVSELTAEQRQELSGLLGTPLGAGLDLSSISFDQTPMETAEALIESLSRDQSS